MARQREHTDVNATTAPVGGGAQSVVVPGEGVRVDRLATELPHAEARSRFGGVDPMAILGGTMAALGTLALLSALAGALGRIGYEQGAGKDQLSTAGIVTGLLVLGLSLLFGGYVAGRVARYEGKRNGLLTGLAFVALCALLATAASSVERLRELELPRFLDSDLSVAALASTVTALIVAIGGAVLGGRYGAAYHRRVDDALLGTRPGGLTPYPTGDATGSTTSPATTSPTTTGPATSTTGSTQEGTR